MKKKALLSTIFFISAAIGCSFLYNYFTIKGGNLVNEEPTEHSDSLPLILNNVMRTQNNEGSEAVSSIVENTTLAHRQSTLINGIPGKNIIILLAYFRSGSSWTGGFFNQHPDVMYLFEPLHNQVDHITKNRSAVIQRILENIFRCDFKSAFLKRSNFLPRSRLYGNCRSKETASTYECMSDLCRNYKTITIKLIRADVKDIEPLIVKYPQYYIRVLHLIRDPRGMMLSQQRAKHHKPEVTYKVAQKMCNRMVENLQNGSKLNTRYGNSTYMVVRYEDIAMKPLQWVSEFMNWTGLPLVEQIRKEITVTTENKKGKESPFGLKRANSTETAFAWQKKDKKVEKEIVKQVEEICLTLIDIVGYERFAIKRVVR